jgi:hypothetical protein
VVSQIIFVIVLVICQVNQYIVLEMLAMNLLIVEIVLVFVVVVLGVGLIHYQYHC